MALKKNHPGVESVLALMSAARAPALVVDGDGKVVGVTAEFRQLAHIGRVGKELGDVFNHVSSLRSILRHKQIKLRLKKSNAVLVARLFRPRPETGLTAFIFDRPREERRGLAQERTHKFPHIFHSGSDLVYQFDAGGKLYFVSENVERVTGYSAREFLSGKIHPLDIVHPEDRPMIERELRKVFRYHKSAESLVHRIIRRNGEIGYLLKSWYSIRDASNKFDGVVGINKDITNEKDLERRLQLFHSAFEHSTDAIIITGVDGKIIDVNEAFTDIYGYSRDEAIGKSTAIIQSRHSTAEFYQQMWSSLAEKGQWRGEILNTHKDGSEIPIWLNITPIYLDNTKIGYMGIESDISERKDLEQQIIQTEKLATIGQLAAGVAHEIGTPLNIISGNAEYMLLDMHESDKGYQELSVIINQTKRMSRLMRQLLDFARPKIVSLQAVDLNNVIREVLDFVRIQFNKGDIRIKTGLSERLPMVYGDPALLYQVFLNIVVNAFHAMANGGELLVHTFIEDADLNSSKVAVTVTDTGEGIQPEHMSRLFTPFFTTKDPGKGTGLGLAVAKRIVQEHSGTIKVESEVGKGTAVTIMFNAFK